MHILSSHHRSEFLATPQLVRLTYADGLEGPEPTLLIKASTLLLKYIVQGVRMQLAFSRLGDRLLYALKVHDDEKKPGIIWSILERSEEKAALSALAEGEHCQAFLFNELAVNVAWTSFPISMPGGGGSEMTEGMCTGPADYPTLKNEVSAVLGRFHDDAIRSPDLVVASLPSPIKWNPVLSHFVTSHATVSPIDLFNSDEGGQQEQLAIWLTDSLHPRGVHYSPQIPKGNGYRELTDILLSYEHGSMLIESKTLTILGRSALPDRVRLARDVSRHIAKAINQLRGGIRRLKEGAQVTSRNGVELKVERTQPIHAIILIPELDLIQEREMYGLGMIREFMKDTGGFLHLLDVAELLRVVQAAEMIAARGNETTPMMAFDYYLMERAEKAREEGTLCIEVLLRIGSE